jgi:hypothetical protein
MSTTDFTPLESEEPLRCFRHPNEETYLRCGRCERPICAKCRVRTPVGFRCFECANLQVLPTYAISSEFYLKAAVAGLGVAGVTGALMAFFPDFEFWVALIMGVAVPEAISIAANQKRGPGLQMVAVGSILFGFIVSRVLMETFDTTRPTFIGFFDNLPFYFTQYSILWIAMAIFFAYRRLQ